MSAAARPCPTTLQECRCQRCGTLLARLRLAAGSAVELYCRKCRRHVLVEAR